MDRKRRGFLFGLVGIAAGIGVKKRAAQAAPPNTPPAGLPQSPLSPDGDSVLDHKLTSDRIKWVDRSMQEMATVEVGMTRADLKKVFEEEGGQFAVRRRQYVYRGCPYFKVEAHFKPFGVIIRDREGRELNNEDPRDVIVDISRPYLQYMILD